MTAPTANGAGSDDEPVGAYVERILKEITGDLSAATVFSRPEAVGDRLIITAAVVQRAGGFGIGGGRGTDPERGGVGQGSGGGGGAHTEGRPVAVIEVGPEGVRVRPILDFTRIGLTALAAALTVLRARRVGR